MPAADPYTTLGVARGASAAEIKSAYRKLAKELHPDRNKDNAAAADRFAKVTAAYDLLTDADKRARFDRGEIDADGNPAMPFGFGQGGGGFRAGANSRDFEFSGGGRDAGVDFGDIFDGLFGGRPGGFGGARQAQPPRGANVNYRLAVPFEDAATLSPQRVTLADGKTIELKVPAGVESGTQMRLPGKGQPGPGGSGDATVTIEVQAHRFFTRDRDHVRVDLPVTLREAVLGAVVRVPTVEGPVNLTIPKGSSSGKTLRLKGRGFTSKAGTRGDQLVTLVVDLPSDNAQLERFAAEWEDARNPRGALGV